MCVASTSMFSGNDTVALDERSAGVERARPDPGAAAELRHVGREEPRHVDDGGVVLAERFDVERHHDRAVVRGLDRRAIGADAVGDDVVRDGAQEDAVAVAAPT